MRRVGQVTGTGFEASPFGYVGKVPTIKSCLERIPSPARRIHHPGHVNSRKAGGIPMTNLKLHVLASALVLSLAAAGCSREDAADVDAAADKTEAETSEALNNAGEGVEAAGQAAGDAATAAGDAVGEAATSAGEEAEEVVDETGAAIDEGVDQAQQETADELRDAGQEANEAATEMEQQTR
jgi:hypothetical protein